MRVGHTVYAGLDQIEAADPALRGRRVGLMTGPSGVTWSLESAVSVIRKRYHLTALFACEHGIRGERQAGEAVDSYVDAETGVTVYSVYRGGHRLTEEMFGAFDVLVFDMQDVGARFYTYLYSLSYAMEECARRGVPLVVLDRLNPLGGEEVAGTVLDKRFSSFVGDYALPTRYGLTIGEYARYVKAHLSLDLDLAVVPLAGWQRDFYLDDTDTPWVPPSPNCPTLSAALCFTGICPFEGTNVSEGRGTALPFELIGAPWIDAAALEARMAALALPGLHFRRVSFVPTFSKHQGVLCHGVQMHVLNRSAAEPFLGGLSLMDEIRALHPDAFRFEAQGGQYFIDKLLGTDAYRLGQLNARALTEAHRPKVRAFQELSRPFWLYGRGRSKND